MKRIGAIAARKNAMVIPVGIANTITSRGPVAVVIGEPFNNNQAPSEIEAGKSRRDIGRQIDELLPARIQTVYTRAKELVAAA
jgi:RNase H-fold protein (predicted Holliday junction resolvase)